MSDPTRPRSIALVDVSYLFKKRFHTTDPKKGERFAAAKLTLGDLEKLRDGVEHVIICRDAPPYNHRLEVFPEYKANRPEVEPEERAQKRWLYEHMKAAGYAIAWSQGYEADDVIATLAKSYGEWCADVRIVGPDKDISQCVTRNVTQYVPPTGERDWEIRDFAGVQKKFGVFPEFMPLYQALVGDAGDNIPGVPSFGPKTAAAYVNKYQTLERLAVGLAEESAAAGPRPPVALQKLAAHWPDLVLSLKLVTLDTNVPLDPEALLVRPEPVTVAPARRMDELPGFTGNETPANAEQADAFEDALKGYQDKLPTLQKAAGIEAVKDAELLEQENERERSANEEHDATSNAPGEKAAERAVPPKRVAAPRSGTTAIVTAPPTYTQSRFGLVTQDLQPLDLDSGRTLARWFFESDLYPKFKSEQAVFTIIAKARELGLKVTVALDNFHLIEGKPSASADLIRALAERDPNFEYLMPIEIGPTKVVWEGKHKRQPKPVPYPYTIEDAIKAGLARSGNYGKPSNWEKRPQDMLMKTAGSKLARLLWPAATMGLYCLEELGFSQEEVEAREAA